VNIYGQNQSETIGKDRHGRQHVSASGGAGLCASFGTAQALYGVLTEVEALGLELTEVRRLPPSDQPREPPS